MSLGRAVTKLCKGLHHHRSSVPLRTKTFNSPSNSGKLIISCEHDFGGHSWSKHSRGAFQWVFLSGQAVLLLGTWSMPSMADDGSIDSSSKNGTSVTDFSGLRKVEDGSVISNEHTAKWRVFTDSGRDVFMRGNIEQAEKFFVSALQEAKEGFGESDPHVAAACNNLAEIFKVKKDFDNAEPLYLQTINILEEHFGTDDITVGAALHNLGQFYIVQHKLEKARVCYERALKIKRRVLGEEHTEYADTMHRLGHVLYLQGNEKDAEDLVVDSIRILEANHQGESISWVRKMQYLAQMYTNSERYTEAEILFRKILHVMELSKGWESLETIFAAERLGMALLRANRSKESAELLERCLDGLKNLLPNEHIQVARNMLYLGIAKMSSSCEILKTNCSRSMAELDKAKDLLCNAIRIAQQLLDRSLGQKGPKGLVGAPGKAGKEAHSAINMLLQIHCFLATLEVMKLDFPGPEASLWKQESVSGEADAAVRKCISFFKEFEPELSDSPTLKVEYLAYLQRMDDMLSKSAQKEVKDEIRKRLMDELQRLEGKIPKAGKPSIFIGFSWHLGN